MGERHLYSGSEVVRRAREKLECTEYNFLFNNCEHFAKYCKIGKGECSQANDLLNCLNPLEFFKGFFR